MQANDKGGSLLFIIRLENSVAESGVPEVSSIFVIGIVSIFQPCISLLLKRLQLLASLGDALADIFFVLVRVDCHVVQELRETRGPVLIVQVVDLFLQSETSGR